MISTLLVLILLLQVKHLFADFYLQTPKMLSGRGIYMHWGRAQHAGVHAIGSVIVLLMTGTPMLALIVLVVAEWIAHFHIDYWKGSYSDKKKLAPDQAAFWRAFGFDQFLHQLTYVAMIWVWTFWVLGKPL
ncbi:MAG: DUF3307 domain-containing protein [Paracoccaceae bacterium]